MSRVSTAERAPRSASRPRRLSGACQLLDPSVACVPLRGCRSAGVDCLAPYRGGVAASVLRDDRLVDRRHVGPSIWRAEAVEYQVVGRDPDPFDHDALVRCLLRIVRVRTDGSARGRVDLSGPARGGRRRLATRARAGRAHRCSRSRPRRSCRARRARCRTDSRSQRSAPPIPWEPNVGSGAPPARRRMIIGLLPPFVRPATETLPPAIVRSWRLKSGAIPALSTPVPKESWGCPLALSCADEGQVGAVVPVETEDQGAAGPNVEAERVVVAALEEVERRLAVATEARVRGPVGLQFSDGGVPLGVGRVA